MKKRMAAVVMTLGIVGIMMTGCGISTNFSSTKTTTTTNADGTTVTTTTRSSHSSSNGSHSSTKTTETTTTDADGNTTFEETTEDGPVTKYDQVAFNVVNDMDFDISEMYINFSGDDATGENLIPEDAVLAVGYETGDAITFSCDTDHTVIDITVVDEDGIPATFKNVDVASSTDPEKIEIDLECGTEAGEYTAIVC